MAVMYRWDAALGKSVPVTGSPGPKGDPGTPGAPGTPGTNGTNGTNGWSPVITVVSDGERRVLRVDDWAGGTGTKPGGGYVTASGALSAVIANGVDVRGAAGAPGPSGTMTAPSNMLTTDTDQAVSATKTFNKMPIATGVRLKNNGDYNSTSTSMFLQNPAGNKEWEFYANAGGEWGVFDKSRGMGIIVARVDAKDSSMILGPTGTTFSGTVTAAGVYDGESRVYSAANPPPSSGGGTASGATVLKTAADQAFSTTTLAPISGWTVPLAANDVETIEATLYLSVPATTTGWQLALVPRTVGGGAAITPVRFVGILEYQTSATAWATFTQNVPTTYMAVTTASPFANQAFLVRISAQVEVGATAGELQFQLRSEVAGSAVTSRKGNTLRYF